MLSKNTHKIYLHYTKPVLHILGIKLVVHIFKKIHRNVLPSFGNSPFSSLFMLLKIDKLPSKHMDRHDDCYKPRAELERELVKMCH